MAEQSPLVSIDWLATQSGLRDQPANNKLVVVDGSWYMPADKRDAAAEYRQGHIPGAVFFDLDGISDTTSALPHMLPTPEAFAKAVGALGISDQSTIVVYDGSGLFSAARVWWTFRHFGAHDVYVLDGGFPLWKEQGLPVETGTVSRPAAVFNPNEKLEAAINAEDLLNKLETGAVQVVDARAAARFRGEVAEPRPGLRSGHIPGSRNLPFGELLNNGRLKSPQDIEALFGQAGVTTDKPVIVSCGSGVTAAVLALGLATTRNPVQALYDGSWSEWGSREDLPLATGPA